MKWLLGLLILPIFSWGACDGLKTAIESCSPYSCEIVTPIIGRVAGQKVKGREGDACIIITEMISDKKGGKDRITNCRVLVKALPFLATQLSSETELLEMAMEINLTDKKRTHAEMTKSYDEMTKKQQAWHLIKEDLEKNLLAANDGKAACSLSK